MNLLPSDYFVFFLFFSAIASIFYIRTQPHYLEPWKKVFQTHTGKITFSVLCIYGFIGLLDSIHLFASQTSVLDLIIGHLNTLDQKTYSAPFTTKALHVLGTNKIGEDMLYLSLKSIRTGLLIGTLTTIFMLPFALLFGLLAGYFGGWVDDIIQYLYTTLSSIPGVLLITATMLVMQVYISEHADLFPTIADRADARLLMLCLILGITSWASLCRLLRAETLKLREQDFVTASVAMGAKRWFILFRHILPNVIHIVLITIVLDFSGLVLAEAVLSYVGVGVDPTTPSWGNMINTSRLELARDPLVWWPLASALIFMFFLVLSANLFSDCVRDAFDPRI